MSTASGRWSTGGTRCSRGVNTAVRQMDEMTQHNAALVEQTDAAIEQTEGQAAKVDSLVEVFTIDRAGRAAGGNVVRAPRSVGKRRAPVFRSEGSAAISADWNEL